MKKNEKQQTTTVARSIDELEKRIKNYPRLPQYLSTFVSKQIDLDSL